MDITPIINNAIIHINESFAKCSTPDHYLLQQIRSLSSLLAAYESETPPDTVYKTRSMGFRAHLDMQNIKAGLQNEADINTEHKLRVYMREVILAIGMASQGKPSAKSTQSPQVGYDHKEAFALTTQTTIAIHRKQYAKYADFFTVLYIRTNARQLLLNGTTPALESTLIVLAKTCTSWIDTHKKPRNTSIVYKQIVDTCMESTRLLTTVSAQHAYEVLTTSFYGLSPIQG